MSISASNYLQNNVQIRLRDRTLLFRYFALVNLIIGGWYLGWRWSSSLNLDVPWFSMPLALAETYMYVGGALFLIGLWRPIVRQVRSLDHLMPALAEDDYPTVDVFITCYNEPTSIVEATAGAALQLDYPVDKLKVYILDDGNSPNMRAMAERLCLQDLQMPALQQAAERLNIERYALSSRLEQLQLLEPELNSLESWAATYTFQALSRSEEIERVLDWFNGLKPAHLADDIWCACQTLLGEGFDNAVCHAHRQLPADTPIMLEAAICDSSVILKIWDQGPAFDFEGKLQTVPTAIAVEAERGRGLNILSQLAEHLSYVRVADGRNCLTLIKMAAGDSNATTGAVVGYAQSLRQVVLWSHAADSTTDFVRQQMWQLVTLIDCKMQAL
ncbi:MAG: ATP-binding protein [Leptolyngbyaceae cyanobacterium]